MKCQYENTEGNTAGIIRKRTQPAKKQKMTLQQLADASGVSLGSVKRFESSGEISLQSMIKIASALGCEDDFSAIFAKNIPMSIEEIINGEI